MRILYICRVFSGFEESLKSQIWKPTGAPTIFKMMEALDESAHEVRFIMTARGVGSEFLSRWDSKTDNDVTLENLRQSILIIASEGRFIARLGKLRGYLAEIIRLYKICLEVKRFKPEIIYFDRSNVFIGGLLSRFTSYPVVIRIMGIYPSMRKIQHSMKIADLLQRWAFKSPFAFALCTQDGSGGELWMDRALRPGVPRKMLLNGVSGSSILGAIDKKLLTIPKDKLIFMFVGRLESIKGCREFIDACLISKSSVGKKIHAVVIGTGSLENEIRTTVKDSDATSMFTFIPRLHHEQIPNAHMIADVYVSLNHLGNLSNANLECMYSNLCMIIPYSRKVDNIDAATDLLVPESAVIRISPHNMTQELASRIIDIASDPNMIDNYKAAMQKAAPKFLVSWDRRIADEISILESIVRQET